MTSAGKGNTDTKRIEWLEAQLAKESYTGKVLFRWSRHGHGWRLHETSRPGAFVTVRGAIDAAMEDDIQKEGKVVGKCPKQS